MMRITLDEATQQLLRAAAVGNVKAIQEALERGADVNARNLDRDTPLHCAARNGKTETARFLIEKGANVNAKNEQQKTPLHIAACHRQTDTARLLIDKGADVNAKDGMDRTPLDCAIDTNPTPIIELLHSASKSASHADRVSQDRDNAKDTGGRRPMRG